MFDFSESICRVWRVFFLIGKRKQKEKGKWLLRREDKGKEEKEVNKGEEVGIS